LTNDSHFFFFFFFFFFFSFFFFLKKEIWAFLTLELRSVLCKRLRSFRNCSRNAIATEMRLSRLVRSPRIVLGIETSCDDTGVALLTRLPSGEVKVLAQRVRPQWDLVSRFGGVFPDEAWRAHDAAIDGLLAEVLLEAKIESMSEIDSIAVTLGPGLAPCLIVGAKRAQQYSQRFNLPVVGVNHLHAHAMTPLLDGTGPKQAPFLAIILSGGHSMIVECRGDSNRPEDCIDPAKFRVLGKCLVRKNWVFFGFFFVKKKKN
jgi:hypothetical protein